MSYCEDMDSDRDPSNQGAVASLGELFFQQARRFHARPFLHWKSADGWHAWSWDDAARAVANLAAHFVASDLEPGARVAILAENRPEWLLADLACFTAGLVDVPIYPTNPASEVESLLARSGVAALFVSGVEQWRKVAPLLPRLPRLRQVIAFDHGDFGNGDTGSRTVAQPSIAPQSFATIAAGERGDANGFAAHAAEVKRRLRQVGRDDLATILYTSGTTGPPKGVMLTHGNLLANCSAILAHIELTPRDKVLSFLPLSHCFERTAGHYALLMAGGEIAYATAPDKVATEIREVRPTVVLGVPRFYEKVHDRLLGAIERAPRYRRALFDFALRVADELEQWRGAAAAGAALPMRLKLRHELAERLVLSLLRRRLGGRLRFFVSGGAPLDPQLVRFFAKLGLPILEGYGLTETAPVITCNRLGRVRPGSVGEPLPGVAIAIAADGEIIVRGPNVMRGYLDDAVATREVMTADGALRTGDVGHLDDDGYLFVTDRKKDLIIGSGGKNIAPAHLEALLKRHRIIADVCLIGDRRPYLIALIVADEAALKTLLEERGVAWSSRDEMLAHTAVLALFDAAIEATNRELAPPERVRRFALLPEPFSTENRELTPTLKVRRRAIEERYHTQIEQLYRAPPAAAPPTTLSPDGGCRG